jgi:hypothetical protein
MKGVIVVVASSTADARTYTLSGGSAQHYVHNSTAGLRKKICVRVEIRHKLADRGLLLLF